MSKQIVTELRMLGALMFDPRPKSTVHGAADLIEALTKQRDELSEAAFVLIGDPMLGETSGSTSSTNMFVTFSALRRVRAAIAAAERNTE